MRHVAFLSIVLPLVFAAAPGATETPERSQSRYLLGPQDRLMVRVHSLRRNIGEAHAWESLNGEFAVGADGTVSMPIVGQVRAAGGTTAELADQISRILKETANLADLPSASVEVFKHRPFFVLGAVQLPGKYEF
ncbi:MAG: polysaccharide biosynthesis/export family protein, partial [Ensifer adhaerens]